MKQIPVGQGKFAIVDDEDYPYLSRLKWVLNNGGYPVIQFQRRKIHVANIKMPELIKRKKNWWEDYIYKNHDSLDNRKENIMIGDHSSKLAYARLRKNKISSKYKGVCWSKKKKKWRARISIHRKEIQIGMFESENQAAIAYNNKSKELYGEFAYQNIIE